ncbi:hypothetical protein [Rhodopila globiformis]|uniref:Uncharacterized protein n=1 Tax=Rhodopila globiformis TaxID=1071 RepID=A0A2S6N1T5_RHOGL|nr:hypothetical protein [Rhodopila globiformis]PPQ28581.1 hypothetical protein CCS01_24070 [Rhodopila globiformis]
MTLYNPVAAVTHDGLAKQAPNRETQAVLPLRGKILNVASASAGKPRQNQELRDLIDGPAERCPWMA